jgi:endonuclease/exonuclease/phosphatase (EEP) superfamily protein YafD
MPLWQAVVVAGGIVLLVISIAALPLSDWWVANAITNLRVQLTASGLVVLALGLVLRAPGTALIGAAAVLVNGLIVLNSLRPATAAPPAGAPGTLLRVMSHNLLYSSRDAAALFRQIDRIQPDVLLLQEVGRFWAGALQELRDRFPFGLELPRIDLSSHGHGVVLLSRHPILERDQRSLGAPTVRFAAARLAVGEQRLWVASMHAAKPNGPAALRLQQAQLDEVAAWINERDGPVVLGGDLNATACAPQIRRLLAATGLSLDQQASPSQAFVSTFPAVLPVLGLKLDHILVRGLTIRQARTLPPGGSDHRPVVAEIALPADTPTRRVEQPSAAEVR